MNSEIDYVKSFNALIDEIQCFIEQIDLGVDRATTILNTANRLKDYAYKRFCFFYIGLTPQPSSVSVPNFCTCRDIEKLKLSPPDPEEDYPKYTREKVLDWLLEQIANDLIILRHAYTDRQMGGRGQKTLSIADLFAQDALQLAIKSERKLINENTAVLTYFSKIHSARIIPYAPVALIGIPANTLCNDRDFLVIAHEVAHHVYWHAKVKEDKSIDKRLSSKLNDSFNVFIKSNESIKSLKARNQNDHQEKILETWLEEIFADIYACMIAGPVIALEIHHLLSDNFDVFTNDGFHPIPIFRPFIFSKVFHFLAGGEMGDYSTPKYLEDRADELFGRVSSEPDEILKILLGLVDEFLEFFVAQGFFKGKDTNRTLRVSPWTPMLSVDGGDVETFIYNSYKTHVAYLKDLKEVMDSNTDVERNTIYEKYDKEIDFYTRRVAPDLVEKYTKYLRNLRNFKKVNLKIELKETSEKPEFNFDNLFDKWTTDCNTLHMNFLPKEDKKKTEDFGWRDLISQSTWTYAGPEGDGSNPP